MFIPLFNLLHSAFSVWDAKGLTSLCKEEWKIISEVMTSVVPVLIKLITNPIILFNKFQTKIYFDFQNICMIT